MSKTITAQALPTLQLTDHDTFALRQLSAQLQREIVSQYETFLFHTNRQVDATRWKRVRSDGDLHAFCERKSALRRDLDRMASQRHAYKYKSSAEQPSHPSVHPQAALAVQSQLRRVLVTGVQCGSLDDIMYGSTFQDSVSFQQFWASQNDAMEQSAVLHTIDGATMDDPYRFLGVTWFLRTFPVPNKVFHQRDLLTLADVHLSKLSNGERVGISVAHSIQHRDLTELTAFETVRATSSVLRVIRQLDKQRVEVFMVQYLDTKGCAPEAFHLQQAVGYMLPSSGHFIDAGFRKKLRWMLQQRRLPHRHERSDSMASDSIEPTSSGNTMHCELCDKTIGRLFSCPGTCCHLCYKRVCLRCSVPQELAVSGSKKALTQTYDFCIECILHAKSQSTLAVAQHELTRRSRSNASTDRSDGGSSISSCSSSSSSCHGVSRTTTTSQSKHEEPRKRALTVLLTTDA